MGLLLLAIGIALVILNIRAIKKEKSSFSNVFHATEENIQEFEVKLGEVRREFSETILELQKEILELKKESFTDNNISNIKEEKKRNENITEEAIQTDIQIKVIKTDNEKSPTKIKTKLENNTIDNSVKIEEIKKLLSSGLSLEEISTRLGVGKGEVLLIKELYLK